MADDAAEAAFDFNRLNHIFGKPMHALDVFLQKYGSQEKAFLAIQEAANNALKSGALTPDAKGILPNGYRGNIIDVAGIKVRLIGGRIMNGEVKISTLSRKGL